MTLALNINYAKLSMMLFSDYGNDVLDCSHSLMGRNAHIYLASANDCHTYFQCYTPLSPPLRRSCGFLLFNPLTNTCDWPSNVVRIRQDCDKTYTMFVPGVVRHLPPSDVTRVAPYNKKGVTGVQPPIHNRKVKIFVKIEIVLLNFK